MRKKGKNIPVNAMADNFGSGIAIEKFSVGGLSAAEIDALNAVDEHNQAHRHHGHSFFLLESGTVEIEIDFQHYTITAPSVIYVHPDQVHHTGLSENVTVSSWAITNENLNPEYLELLKDITPARPLALNPETFAILSEAVALTTKISDRRKDKLQHSLLKDSCNALVALVISQYLEVAKPADKLSRFEVVTKAFRGLLEQNYTRLKRPSDYAQLLNITTPYLNECVRNATGYSVSHHIQQRVVLEAKRLLYHSNRSVKEIAAQLGYDDYPYFSRLFTKVTGVSALAFRNKNFD